MVLWLDVERAGSLEAQKVYHLVDRSDAVLVD